MLKLTFITINSLCSSLSIRYIYIFTMKFFDLFIFESSLASISNMSKDININAFLKLIGSGIRFTIAILYFVFVILIFF